MSGGSAHLGRRFWQLWTANAVSSVGDGMVIVALPLLALGQTHNAFALAAVMAAGQVPAVLAGLPIGALVDRSNRRRLLVRVEILRFAALALFGVAVLAGRGGLGTIYAAALVFGTLNTIFYVTAQSVLPTIVDRDALDVANGHLMNADAVGQEITGRASGGFLLAASRGLPFLADAVTFVASAMLLSRAVPDETQPARRDTSTWVDLRDGLTWFFGHAVLRRLTVLVASLAFCQSMVIALTALWARQDLSLTAGGYGVLLAVGSLGSILGAFVAPRLNRRFGGGRLLVLAAVTAAGAYPVLAVTRTPYLAAGAFFVECATVVSGNVAAGTMRQRLVPPHMQARGVAAYRTVLYTCIPAGSLAGGILASATDIQGAFLAAGVLQLGFVALIGLPLTRPSWTAGPPAEPQALT